MAEDDIPISFTALRTSVSWWPYGRARSYQLAKDPGDGKPPLATIRVGPGRGRVFTTRRAMSEFMSCRMEASPAAKKRASK